MNFEQEYISNKNASKKIRANSQETTLAYLCAN